jgi:omega-6 fatty acid desaturase (delta-12 desaturase)
MFMRHPLTLMSGYITVFFIGMVSYPMFRSPRKHYDCLLALLVHVALNVWVIVCFGWVTALLMIWIPRSIAAAMGSYLFYAQHNFPGVTFKDKGGWTYEGAAMESSSYMRMSPFMQWCTGNIGYHHIHHLNCRIPFYKLPVAMHRIRELQQAKITSLNPRDIWACLRLKVWDPEQQKMIGYREMF